MTNFEKIKEMNLKELAKFLHRKNTVCDAKISCAECKNAAWCNCGSSKDFEKWLLLPA